MSNQPYISDTEKMSVVQLSASDRFSYFVKRVVDWETAWGLWDNGWALVADNAGSVGLPLWPARDYSELLCDHEWKGHVPKAITLAELLNDVLAQLETEKTAVVVFPVPPFKGVSVEPSQLSRSLRAECRHYE